MHLPLCEVRRLQEAENKVTKSNIIERAISSKNFEDLFNENMLGSRWISINYLEKFYKDKGLDSLTDSIRIHAQEVIREDKEQENKDR